MVIDALNVDKSLYRHKINNQRPKSMDITTIGTTILGKVVTTIKSVDTFLRIVLEHILVAITIGG